MKYILFGLTLRSIIHFMKENKILFIIGSILFLIFLPFLFWELRKMSEKIDEEQRARRNKWSALTLNNELPEPLSNLTLSGFQKGGCETRAWLLQIRNIAI